MSVYELARRYYPRLWDDAHIDALVRAGRRICTGPGSCGSTRN